MRTCFAFGVLVLAIAGCSSSGVSNSLAPSVSATDANSSSATSGGSPSEAASTAIGPWSGSTTFTDSGGYKWKVSWTFSASAASDYQPFTVNDSPNQATVQLPTAGTISATNLSDRNAAVPQRIDIIALYPPNDLFCNYYPALGFYGIQRWNGVSHHDCEQALFAGYSGASVAPNQTVTYQPDWGLTGIPDETGASYPSADLYNVPAAKEQAVIMAINTIRPQLMILADASDETLGNCPLGAAVDSQGSSALFSNPAVSGLTCS